MQETINVIEKAIQEKKEFVRRLNHETEKLIERLSDNFSNRISTEKQIARLEIDLKNIYDQHYNKTQDTDNAANLKMGSFKTKSILSDDYTGSKFKKSEPQIADREYAHKPSY